MADQLDADQEDRDAIPPTTYREQLASIVLSYIRPWLEADAHNEFRLRMNAEARHGPGYYGSLLRGARETLRRYDEVFGLIEQLEFRQYRAEQLRRYADAEPLLQYGENENRRENSGEDTGGRRSADQGDLADTALGELGGDRGEEVRNP